MKLKCFHIFKPKLPKPNFSNVHCFSLKRARLKRRRFRPKFKKPFSVKALRLPKCHRPTKLKFKKPREKIRFEKKTTLVPDDRFGEKVSELVSVFRSSGSKELDRVIDPIPIIEKTEQSLLDSPIDDGFATWPTSDVKEVGPYAGVCRSFENYVAEMIVAEGKMKDLMDVEEMLYCWRNLKSPVFVDLVSRFYGEMCKDLFSVEDEEDDEEEEEGKITTDSTTSITTTATTATTATSE